MPGNKGAELQSREDNVLNSESVPSQTISYVWGRISRYTSFGDVYLLMPLLCSEKFLLEEVVQKSQ